MFDPPHLDRVGKTAWMGQLNQGGELLYGGCFIMPSLFKMNINSDYIFQGYY